VRATLQLWLLAASGLTVLPHGSFAINHTHIAAVSNLSQAVMDAVGRQRWFFTHASVGGNIVEGMHTLQAGRPTRYKLSIYNWPGADGSYHGGVATTGSFGGANYRAATAPSSTSSGMIYECYRENPPWQNKFACFSNSFSMSGWGNGKVDFAMDKLCWIDPDANSTTYVACMSRLEQMYPAVRMVYVTIPLTGLHDSENNLRNNYNRAIRAFCTLHSNLLYDVADIQAWAPNGVQQTYVSGGVTNQKLYSGYASDPGGGDWHLNSAGQERLALGWYALAASAVTNTAVPLVFRAVALTDNVILRWSDPTASGVTNACVHIRSATNDYPANTAAGVSVYTGTNRMHEDAGLISGQAYYYSVWISNDGANFTNPP